MWLFLSHLYFTKKYSYIPRYRVEIKGKISVAWDMKQKNKGKKLL